jgi:hypothetical protein
VSVRRGVLVRPVIAVTLERSTILAFGRHEEHEVTKHTKNLTLVNGLRGLRDQVKGPSLLPTT